MLFNPRKFDKAVTLLTLGIASACPVFAQSQPATLGQPAASAPASLTATEAGKLAFDAASVRPSTQEFVLKGMDFLNPAGDAVPPPGGLFSWMCSSPG
jgi:hypothetical protein